MGARINRVKQQVEECAEGSAAQALARCAELNERLAAETIDVTLLAAAAAARHLHPVMRTWERVEADLRHHRFRRGRRPRDRNRLDTTSPR